ncbi:MAG: metal-dependent hydrolase [Bacteroidota bacterium]
MDSLTHIVYGAALGEAMLGKKIGHRAALVGAIVNSLPDLDVIATSIAHDDISYFEIHRSYSHAALPLILFAFPLAWLLNKMLPGKFSSRYWYLFSVVGLLTHSLLDCFTTFGTQLLLPFTNYLVGFNNLSIIDPSFTLPMLVLVVICFFFKREKPLRQKFAVAGLAYCVTYLLFTFTMKYSAYTVFRDDLKTKGVKANTIYTTPSMLNCLLWSGIAISGDTIYTGEYSVLQKKKVVNWLAFPKNSSVLNQVTLKHDVEVLKWFSQDKYFVWQKGDTLQFYNIKWGRADLRFTEPEKTFLFYFRFYKVNGEWKRSVVEPHLDGKIGDAIKMIFDRILDRPLPVKPAE